MVDYSLICKAGDGKLLEDGDVPTMGMLSSSSVTSCSSMVVLISPKLLALMSLTAPWHSSSLAFTSTTQWLLPYRVMAEMVWSNCW